MVQSESWLQSGPLHENATAEREQPPIWALMSSANCTTARWLHDARVAHVSSALFSSHSAAVIVANYLLITGAANLCLVTFAEFCRQSRRARKSRPKMRSERDQSQDLVGVALEAEKSGLQCASAESAARLVYGSTPTRLVSGQIGRANLLHGRPLRELAFREGTARVDSRAAASRRRTKILYLIASQNIKATPPNDLGVGWTRRTISKPRPRVYCSAGRCRPCANLHPAGTKTGPLRGQVRGGHISRGLEPEEPAESLLVIALEWFLRTRTTRERVAMNSLDNTCRLAKNPPLLIRVAETLRRVQLRQFDAQVDLARSLRAAPEISSSVIEPLDRLT